MYIDCDWGRRMETLVELMQLCPHKSMKKLQREAMKYYPLYYTESKRAWMSVKTSFHAADILNKREGLLCNTPTTAISA